MDGSQRRPFATAALAQPLLLKLVMHLRRLVNVLLSVASGEGFPMLLRRAQQSFMSGADMRITAAFIALLLIVGVMGCSGSDKDRATQPTGSLPSFPNTTAGAGGAGVANGDQQVETAPESSGGYSLPASTPYNQGNGAAVSQNLNPAPFLMAKEPSNTTGVNISNSSGLIARADGDMYGPSDLPAAGVGPGMQGAAEGGAVRSSNAVGRTPSREAKKPANEAPEPPHK